MRFLPILLAVLALAINARIIFPNHAEPSDYISNPGKIIIGARNPTNATTEKPIPLWLANKIKSQNEEKWRRWSRCRLLGLCSNNTVIDNGKKNLKKA